MSYIGKIFQDAATQVKLSKREKPIVYCDCGNTLFGTQFEGGMNNPLFHFLVALKQAGYDVRLMSDEPRKYTPRIKEYLKSLGLKGHFFQDEDGITVTIKGSIGEVMAFIVIDNNHMSHKIRAPRFINPHADDFVKALIPFAKSTKSLPDNLAPKVLFQ